MNQICSIATYFSDLTPKQILFWTGAGISADAPTCGPLGRTLTDRVLETFLEPGIGDQLYELYHRLSVPNAAFRPRLETVLDALHEIYGTGGLADVLSDLNSAIPNDIHTFFAAHLDAGGSHITANFDTCIERALPGDRPVMHFHGKLGHAQSLSSLGALISIIENGFSHAVVKDLDSLLFNPELKVIIFAGYSGSDFFDGTPYLSSRWSAFADKKVIWHDYRSSPQVALTGEACDAHPQLRLARAAGAEVIWL